MTKFGAILALSICAGGCSETDLGEPPDCTFDASTYEGTAPLSVTFAVTVGEGTDYTVKKYEWDYDGDGTVDETTETAQTDISVSHTYAVAGEYAPDVKVVYNEADAWTSPLFSDSLSQKIVVTAAQ